MSVVDEVDMSVVDEVDMSVSLAETSPVVVESSVVLSSPVEASPDDELTPASLSLSLSLPVPAVELDADRRRRRRRHVVAA
ncbi:MAG: hypothetical protein R3A79_21995 [Nannocystaceae bacterium]